jgi:hypothetical protein
MMHTVNAFVAVVVAVVVIAAVHLQTDLLMAASAVRTVRTVTFVLAYSVVFSLLVSVFVNVGY